MESAARRYTDSLWKFVGDPKKLYPGLPKDPRTILKTPTDYNIGRTASSGEYYHFGLASGLEACFVLCSLPTHLQLQFNVHNLPLFKSPARVQAQSHLKLDVHCGRTKPQSLEDFLTEFLEDVQAE